MQHWPDTRDTLMTRLSDPTDQVAWQEFVAIYQPVIYRFARQRGLQDADASDITQRVLWSVARAADRWKPGTEHGRLRGWLAKVTSNAVINLMTRERWKQASGRTTIWEWINESAAVDPELSREWEHERRLQLFRIAAEEVKQNVTDDTWLAFYRTAVAEQTAEDVAKELSKSVGAVYAAKSRVLAKIREAVNRMQAQESDVENDMGIDSNSQES